MGEKYSEVRVPCDTMVLTADMGQEDRIGHVRKNTRQGFIQFEIDRLEEVVFTLGCRSSVKIRIKHCKIYYLS